LRKSGAGVERTSGRGGGGEGAIPSSSKVRQGIRGGSIGISKEPPKEAFVTTRESQERNHHLKKKKRERYRGGQKKKGISPYL